MPDAPKIFPLGDAAVAVDFGNEISVSLNTKAISLAEYFNEIRFPGFVEAVPAYSSVAIFYDLKKVCRHYPEFSTAFEAVSGMIKTALARRVETITTDSRIIEIPTDFGDDSAIDLGLIADYAGMSRDDVLERFTSRTYRVYMLGFLPGFSYMGEVDRRIAMPRKDSPRKKVPKGSVGIAGSQTGIYPLESPGGWQIIGRTDVEMFTPHNDPPCLLKPGDEVRFVPVQ